MRIHILQSRMSFEQADILQYYLDAKEQVINAKIQERTADVTVSYQGSREEILSVLEAFTYERAQVPEVYLKNSGRQMNRVLGQAGQQNSDLFWKQDLSSLSDPGRDHHDHFRKIHLEGTDDSCQAKD